MESPSERVAAARQAEPQLAAAVDAAASVAASRALSREHWLMVGASFVALLGLGVMRLVLSPDPHGVGTHEQLGLPPCQAIDWFGVPCPGCGVTTAVTWFAHGDPWKSLATQPLGFALALGAVVALPVAVVATAARRDLAQLALAWSTRRTWTALAAFVALAWIYKIVVVVAD